MPEPIIGVAESVADGHWCKNCEFFEEEMPEENGQCLACGCGVQDHDQVQIVKVRLT